MGCGGCIALVLVIGLIVAAAMSIAALIDPFSWMPSIGDVFADCPPAVEVGRSCDLSDRSGFLAPRGGQPRLRRGRRRLLVALVPAVGNCATPVSRASTTMRRRALPRRARTPRRGRRADRGARPAAACGRGPLTTVMLASGRGRAAARVRLLDLVVTAGGDVRDGGRAQRAAHVRRSVTAARSRSSTALGVAVWLVDVPLGERAAAGEADRGEPAVVANSLPELGPLVLPARAARGAADPCAAGDRRLLAEIDDAIVEPDAPPARARRPVQQHTARGGVGAVTRDECHQQLTVLETGQVGERGMVTAPAPQRRAAGPAIDQDRVPRIERDAPAVRVARAKGRSAMWGDESPRPLRF